MDLISASQTVNFPHSIPSILPTASFPSTFFLHTTAKLIAAGSPGDYLLHCLVIFHLISPIRFFFPSHTFGLHVAAVEKHSTVPTPISFGLHFQSHCPLNTAQGFFYKPALQNCSSIKPLLFSLSPHLSAVLLKSPPPPLSKSCLYILSSLPRCPRRTCTLILLEDSTWALDPFPSQLACLNQSFLFSSLSLSLSSLALH